VARPKTGPGDWKPSEGGRPPDPKYVSFKLAHPDYADDAELVPSDRLADALWKQWRAVEEDSDQCVVLQLSFKGLRGVKPAAVTECLVYFLGGVIVGLRPFYVVFEDIGDESIWTSLGDRLNRAGLIALANQAALLEGRKVRVRDSTYKLIGDYATVDRCEDYWYALAAEKDWVKGGIFAAQKGMPPAIMNKMYDQGVALKAKNKSLFRAPV